MFATLNRRSLGHLRSSSAPAVPRARCPLDDRVTQPLRPPRLLPHPSHGLTGAVLCLVPDNFVASSALLRFPQGSKSCFLSDYYHCDTVRTRGPTSSRFRSPQESASTLYLVPCTSPARPVHARPYVRHSRWKTSVVTRNAQEPREPDVRRPTSVPRSATPVTGPSALSFVDLHGRQLVDGDRLAHVVCVSPLPGVV
ncbi:hypothetical protein K466DRAFT_375185 [Polyporus arcularius HHB13444]|uniref:Uncharacterized protein n=1 Tax=Polyporus arcularius HHB13444 TaxID=1314778 RepID=A0A5C3NUS4_9APHY|nr:hypothetical protein K466DRAFT_375185 [Polyporus arcularius HHB13444]